VDGDQTIVRMDGSNGKYFVTNDPNCGNVIYSSAYATTFSNLYVCGQCKGGCPQVDGGEVTPVLALMVLPYLSLRVLVQCIACWCTPLSLHLPCAC
jgi:predicted RNA-binding Zn-ribbon protein involved in translation (DUF1610 family)